eukprot:4277897-Pyramimonas_sp.AAC.1
MGQAAVRVCMSEWRPAGPSNIQPGDAAREGRLHRHWRVSCPRKRRTRAPSSAMQRAALAARV